MRNLDRADIVALTMVRAAFGNEYDIAVRKARESGDAVYGLRKKAFVTCHKDGEGGQRDGLGYERSRFFEDLAVADNEIR